MSQTDRILPRYILSRVRVSVRPRIFLYAKKTQTTVARAVAVDHRSEADKQLNWNGHNPFSWVAQRQELSAKKLLRSAAIRVQIPCREHYCFHFYCLRLTRNIISNMIMIFNINSTRGQTRFLASVARVTCLVFYNSIPHTLIILFV